MKNGLKILLLEDNPDDVELIKLQLKRMKLDFDYELVQNQPDYENALHGFNPDLILSDYSLPSFDGITAYEILKETGLDIPFFLVTGEVSEDFAVSCLKTGMEDYILKSNLGRLPQAIEQGFNKRENEKKIKLSEKFQSLSSEILKHLNSEHNLKEVIGSVIKCIQDEMHYDAVGLRLKNKNDYPYYEQNGFSEGFLITENSLIAKNKEGKICLNKEGKPLLECTCGLVISGGVDSTSPLFTEYGSFWTNDSYQLLVLTPEEDPRYHPRNTCIHQGFGSVAIIPIITNKHIVGTLQLNVKGKNAFTEDTINFFEGISLNIGNTLMRKQAIEELKESESRLKEYAEELEVKNKQLVDFINIVSHNLRAPLVNVTMLVDILTQSQDEEERKEMFGHMKSVTGNLNEIFNELVESLQVRQDTGILKEQVNLKDSLEKILLAFKPEIIINNAHIEMNFTDAECVHSHTKYIDSIFTNFISNSLKYKSPERPLEIKVRTEKINDNVILSVSDNGLGIDLKLHKDNLFKIRKTFHKHPEAKGFGLFMTKTMVESMGGKIWAESTPGVGSTFFVEFIEQNEKIDAAY